MHIKKLHRTTQLACLAVVAMVFVLFFRDVVSGDRTFAFRDSGHYYLPLFAWNQDEWEAGRVPLWNPQENTGVPQVADTSSSVFYPGKLIFGFGELHIVTRYNAYIMLHFALALCGVWLVGAHMRMSIAGRALAMISYAFSGAVLTQASNVVFLVGAAWLPLAVLFILMLRKRPIAGVLGLSATQAMMVLGGDPQMAYHVVVIGLMWVWVRRERNRDADGTESSESWPERIKSVVVSRLQSPACRQAALIVAGSTIALVLSAVQVLPSAVWSRTSARASYDLPRSIYEVLPHTLSPSSTDQRSVHDAAVESANGLMGEPVRGTHADHTYQYSVPPWTLAEMLFPNVSGKMFPVHRRWANGLPGADRVWNPTLYAGLLPLLFAMSGWSLRSKNRQRRWLSIVLAFAILASLGWFGLGWLVREVLWLLAGTPPGQVRIGSPVGGIYWLLVTLLPLYAQFRYPAKWFVVAALSLSLLAGVSLRKPSAQFEVMRSGYWVGGAALVLLSLTFLLSRALLEWFGSIPFDPLFGPLDASGALDDIRIGLAHAIIVMIGAILIWQIGDRLGAPRHVVAIGLVTLTAADLAIANRWTLGTAPRSSWAFESRSHDDLTQSVDRNDTSRIYRGNLYGWLPASYYTSSSRDRLNEVVIWDRQTSFPKHHLVGEHLLAESYGSIAAADVESFMRVARDYGPERSDGLRELPPEILDLLGVRQVIVPEQGIWRAWEAPEESPLSGVESAWTASRRDYLERIWLVESVVQIEPPRRLHDRELDRATLDTFFDGDQWRDFSSVAVVEQSLAHSFAATGSDPSSLGSATLEQCDPQYLRIHVVSERPAFLVVSDYYAPGWKASLRPLHVNGPTHEVDIVRTNRIFRGVAVPEGRWIVEFHYQPKDFYWGWRISLGAWLVWCLVFAGCLARTKLPLKRVKSGARGR